MSKQRSASAKQPASNKRAAKAPAGSSGQVTLLTGGNPQIPKGDGDEPVQAYIAAMPDWKRGVGLRLDRLVEETVPNVRKAVRWNTPFYGIEGQGWFLAFHCFARYIKVTFFNGTLLRPVPPEASKQAGVRYFHIHEGEPIDESQMVEWIRHAAALPGEHLFT
ncbi:MAG: DUF1801 domain-containing protein [Phycisphaerales bacterium]|nr:DUF1801 domain-containing protein [Phycisphaerales bacterium]